MRPKLKKMTWAESHFVNATLQWEIRSNMRPKKCTGVYNSYWVERGGLKGIIEGSLDYIKTFPEVPLLPDHPIYEKWRKRRER